ncbi:MAG: hypothetical protein Q7T54_00585 [Candidatus Levybacteria bacterium]|nr:hypothetical protein [Candidatus Levybacteria bacterium]
MIQLILEGTYTLFDTKKNTKVLLLENSKKRSFAWIDAQGIGEILVESEKVHQKNNILSIGKFRLYKVEDEPKFTDLEHLELFVGSGKWQGYLLPTGLPTIKDKRNRIIPTHERITNTAP